MARVNRENRPDSSSSARSQYGNRSSLIESDRSRHINRDHSRFNGDITLARRGKYISVLSTETPDSQKSEKIQHIKREHLGSKMINREQNGGNRFIMPQNSDTENTVGNKYQQKALSDVSASEAKSATGNAYKKSSAIEKYTEAQTRVDLKSAVQKSKDRNATFAEREMMAERAAAIQEQLKRSTAAEKYNSRSENAKIEAGKPKNEEASNKYFGGKNGQYDPNNKSDRSKAENVARYTEYLKGKALYKYEKKIFKIKAKHYMPSSVDKLNGTISLAKRVTDPMKSGDIGKAVMLPASELVDYVIRKHKGDILLKHRDRLKKGIESAENAPDTGTAMYAATQTIVTDAVKSTASKAVKSLDHAVSEKIQTGITDKIKRANKYLKAEYQKVDVKYQHIYESKIPDKELKALEDFTEKNKDNRLNKKIYNKYMNKSEQLEKLERKHQSAAKGQYAKSQKAKSLNKKAEAAKAAEERKIKAGIFKENAKAFAGKAFHASKSQTIKIIAGGSASIVAPILIIIIIIILISLLFSWQNPFKITLSDETVIEAETEEEILDGYMQMIYDFMQMAEYNCFVTYGDYCSAKYDWEDASLDFQDYYNEVLLPLIEETKAEITKAYGPAIAAASPEERGVLIAKMNQEIANAVEHILAEGQEKFEAILLSLNDYLKDPADYPPTVNKFFPEHEVIRSEKFNLSFDYSKTEMAGCGEPDGYDSGQYSGQTVCSNAFSLGTLLFETDLTAEDIFPYIALSRVISVMNDGTDDESDERDQEIARSFAEITPEEINTFFEKTKFININTHLEDYDCGKCHRKLEGDWHSGWEWKYYCREPGGPYIHKILIGQISVKNEEELLEAVMTEYGAEEAGLTQYDCLDLIDLYKDYIETTLGNNYTKHRIGKNDYHLAKRYYSSHVANDSGAPPHPWRFDTPLETNDEEEENNNETTDT